MRSYRRSGLTAIVVVMLATLAAAASAAATGATMQITPASQTVAGGATFTVRVVQSNSVPTLGAQLTVTFDRTKAQITAVTWGTHFANAPVLIPSDMAGAIAQANTTGKLYKLAATFLVPTDSVPAGDADVLSITFKATGCGNVPLGLPVGPNDASLLDGRDDTIGNALPVTTSPGQVTVDCNATASASASPSSAASPTASSSASSSTPSSGSPTDAASSAEATPTDAASVEGASAEATSDTSTLAGATSSSSGSDGGLPIWLPLVLTIPAIAIVGLGLVRLRQTETRPTIPDRH